MTTPQSVTIPKWQIASSWVLSCLPLLAFLPSAFFKIAQPGEFLTQWTKNYPAATARPIGIVELGCLFGAFMSWGLKKDLLVPLREQTRAVRVGETCAIGLYLDDTNRLAVTMRVAELLRASALEDDASSSPTRTVCSRSSAARRLPTSATALPPIRFAACSGSARKPSNAPQDGS